MPPDEPTLNDRLGEIHGPDGRLAVWAIIKFWKKSTRLEWSPLIGPTTALRVGSWDQARFSYHGPDSKTPGGASAAKRKRRRT